MKKIFTFKNKRSMPGWLAKLFALLMKVYGWLLRSSVDDAEKMFENHCLGIGKPCIIAYWHNRLLFAGVLFPQRYLDHITVLISASRDGEYISSVVKNFGLGVVRGSSSRGGGEALLELTENLEQHQSVFLTVDGPRGPRYCVHHGVVSLARRTGCPIVPVALNCNRVWQLKSWDKMQIPKPFSKSVFLVGKPIYVDDNVDVEQKCEQVRQALLALTVDPQ